MKISRFLAEVKSAKVPILVACQILICNAALNYELVTSGINCPSVRIALRDSPVTYGLSPL